MQPFLSFLSSCVHKLEYGGIYYKYSTCKQNLQYHPSTNMFLKGWEPLPSLPQMQMSLVMSFWEPCWWLSALWQLSTLVWICQHPYMTIHNEKSLTWQLSSSSCEPSSPLLPPLFKSLSLSVFFFLLKVLFVWQLFLDVFWVGSFRTWIWVNSSLLWTDSIPCPVYSFLSIPHYICIVSSFRLTYSSWFHWLSPLLT